VERVRAPDGREWELRTGRFRLPRWRKNPYERLGAAPALDDLWIASDFVPLGQFAVELPLALARGVVDRGGWIEAVCRYPDARITWRVTNRRELRASLERIGEQLARGYDSLELDGVEIAAVTPPGAVRELS